MSGTCVERIECPKCGSGGLQVFEEDGEYNGLCYGECGTYYHPNMLPEPFKSGEVVKESKPMSMDPSTLPIKEIADRKIRRDTCEEYGVRVAVSETDGKTITSSYYPDTKDGNVTGWEHRNHVTKAFFGIGDRKGELDLWGTSLAKKNNGRKLFITEGRLDAMSLYQTLVDNTSSKYKHLKPSVVSLTRGASGALKDVMNNRAFVESFGEVILVLDNDEAGEKAVKTILTTFTGFKVAQLPLKDANDMLLAGRGKELFDLVMWKAGVIRQGEVVDVSDFIEQALIKPQMGVSTPWPSVNRMTYGFRPHTIWVVGAAPKIGKSDHEYQILHHLSYREQQGVGVFDLENPPAKTAKKIASKQAGIDYTKPDSVYKDEDLRQHLMELQGKVRFYDRGASREWSDIRVAMEEMHLLDDINFFILDPITALVSRFTSSEANDKLNEIMTDVADFVQKFPVTLLMYSHVNPTTKGKPHEEGGRVLSSQFTGSRAMEKWAHYGWGIRRDRSPECPPEEQNVSYLDLLFDRDFGNSGTATLFFNKDDMSYLEM
jgi:twinkle protein